MTSDDYKAKITIMIRKTQLIVIIFFAAALNAGNNLNFLSTNGRRIVNGNDEIILKGVHITNGAYGNWQYPLSDELNEKGLNPMIPPEILPEWSLRNIDFENIKDLGVNVVRYELNYEMFSNTNRNRKSNLNKLKKDIERFNELGIYVIIDHHYMPGLDTQSAQYEDLRKESIREKSIFESDELWGQFVEWWKFMANEFKDNPGIAGYEPFVEPRIPSEKEGGEIQFLKRYNEICKIIRDIDPRHIIFIPQSHSREVGEKINWGPKLFKVDSQFKNIVYSFMAYDPFDFTHSGDLNLEKSEIEHEIKTMINRKISFSKKHNVPLIINEYGVNQLQPRENAMFFFDTIHKLSAENFISTVYYSYKAEVSPWGYSGVNMGIYSEYTAIDDEVIQTGSGYMFKNNVQAKAEKSGFAEYFNKYFTEDNMASSTSITNNEVLLMDLKAYFNN